MAPFDDGCIIVYLFNLILLDKYAGCAIRECIIIAVKQKFVSFVKTKMEWWQAIVDYYTTIGNRYRVDPVIFVGLHVVATPLFAAAVWWIVYNRKKNRSLVLPVITATLIFNAANIYLIAVGRNIPWWIYAIVIGTTLISSFFTIRKIKARLKNAGSGNRSATTAP